LYYGRSSLQPWDILNFDKNLAAGNKGKICSGFLTILAKQIDGTWKIPINCFHATVVGRHKLMLSSLNLIWAVPFIQVLFIPARLVHTLRFTSYNK